MAEKEFNNSEEDGVKIRDGVKGEEQEQEQEQEQEESEDDEMMKVMGFSSFGSKRKKY